MKQLINDHFSVFIVLAVFIFLFAAYLFVIQWHPNVTGTIDWLEGEMKEVIGAIIMGLAPAAKKAIDNLTSPPSSQAPKL